MQTFTSDLEEVARHVNWYSNPQDVLADVDLFLAQVMARGTAEDIVAVQQKYPEEKFKKAYLGSPPGLFTKRAWAYWGLMLLGNSRLPMPERFPEANNFDWRKST